MTLAISRSGGGKLEGLPVVVINMDKDMEELDGKDSGRKGFPVPAVCANRCLRLWTLVERVHDGGGEGGPWLPFTTIRVCSWRERDESTRGNRA